MRSLTIKLTLAFLIVSLAGIALVALLIWGITSIEFSRLISDRGLNEFTKVVTEYYNTNQSWYGITTYIREKETSYQQNISKDTTGQQSPPFIPNQPGDRPNISPFGLVDPSGVVLVAVGPFHEGETVALNRFQEVAKVSYNNAVVGYAVTTGHRPNPNPFEERFLARTTQAMVLAALGATLLAVLLGIFLARTITRPVRDLTVAASAMAQGQLNQQVTVRSKDELGRLTQTFNQMSADLEKSNQMRRQMTADIAHDLRTPLTVITGYLEGLKDGVLKPTPQRFTAMHDEALYLQRLVEDLRTLSLADAGELTLTCQAIQPRDLIERMASSFQNQVDQNHIVLTTEVEEDLPPIKADPERMQQTLCNLVSNAIRYTPEGGQIHLSARCIDGYVSFEVKDNGQGIAAEILPHVFDRFYRGDNSRHEGGSGLGLAIAKSLVELQGGKISAASPGPGLGSIFTVQFPA